MQRKEANMKTASLPSLRVDPELRQDAESVLHQGETLSSFMEQALRASIQSRKSRQEFIARGLASRDEARKTCEYFAADEVLSEMDALLVKSDSRTRR
jgi:predicted transcriptional regulator